MPTIAVNGAELHYEESGDGRPLVFLHGLWMSTRFFQKQIPFFSERYRTVALDFRGHGRSSHVQEGHTVAQYARDVRSFLEELALTDPVLLGWSMGSLVIWDYVRQFGTDGLPGVVVIDQSASDYKWPDWPHGILDFDSLSHFMAGVQTDWDATSRSLISMIFAQPQADADVEWMAAEIGRVPPAIASAILFDQTVQDYRPTLPDVTLPTLLCRGAAGLVSPEAAELMIAAMPDARLVTFERSGHCPFLEESELFNEEVDGFVRSLRSS
jgi:non-heme chloroperoxidase